MDPLTHVLGGALLARASAPAHPRAHQLPVRTRVFVGAAASAFPDADLFLRFVDTLTYLAYHRSLLNSVLLWPLWSLALAFLFSALWRGRYGWRAFVGVCLLAIGLHILADLITAFGSMIFAPLSFNKFAFAMTFIIDPYFTAIIAAGLALSFVWKKSRTPAVAALAVLAIYVGSQGLLQQHALTVAKRYVEANRLGEARVHALPQPLSPFNWMLIVVDAETYHLAYVSLWRTQVAPAVPDDAYSLRRIAASYRPAHQAQWQRLARFGNAVETVGLVRAAWEHDLLRPYRQFAWFPALYRIDNHAGTCVWFRDLQFALIGRGPVFPFGLCREHAGADWRLYQLRGEEKRPTLFR